MDDMIEPIATLLIIEDDNDLLELESFHFEKLGYRVIGVNRTQTVESILENTEVHLMLVDRTLPRVEGSDFVAYLRDKGVDIPVMFISAKDKDNEIEEGFLKGCDDYLRKPFNVNELIHRVKAILKRTHGITSNRIAARDIVMDCNTRKTYIENTCVDLTKLEFELLLLFITHKNKVLERDYLLENVWNNDKNTQKRTINVTINRLRKKIDPEYTKNYISPIRGIGYQFK